MSTALKPRFALSLPRPLARMEREFDELFDRFVGSNGNSAHPAWLAPASLWEEEGYWYVEMELPGVKREDLEITLEKNCLKIAAERAEPEGQRKYWHQERSYGRVERMFTLPETVDPERIEAALADGVLKLSLAKRPEDQPRKIEIKSAK